MPAETSEKPSRTPAEILKAARQRDSADKRGRVLKTVQDMLRDNRRITFAAVAREAGVSSWLVYAPGLRERIDQARARQAAQGHQDQQSGRKVSTASEQTDLLLARQEIKQLRTENGQLRQQARIHLGQQVEQLGNHALVSTASRSSPRRTCDSPRRNGRQPQRTHSSGSESPSSRTTSPLPAPASAA
ncbi:DUF6262 family protein [Streptomyces sp. Ru62]|uniref:DUF6262 family protein n=1 Tax=Streptomyces sp. Ru62 TaxID=2080745 RepID=UPI002155FE7E|nr:DUF6262 family protein [Streptomyces sp. Ru62]